MRNLEQCRCLIALLFAVIASAAGAAPHLIGPNGPDGEEMRAAAESFFTKLDTGDIDGAKALFDGPAEEWAVAQSLSRESAASEAFHKTVITRLGETEIARSLKIFRMAGFRAAGVRNTLAIRNGDAGGVARVALFDPGLEMHRTAGQWKMTRLAVADVDERKYCRMVDALTSMLTDLDHSLQTGGLKTEKDVDTELGTRFNDATREWLDSRPDSQPATQPAVERGPAIAPPVPNIGVMRAALGTAANSDQAVALVAALPGLPSVWQSGASFDVRSQDAGMTLQFTSPGFVLRRVRLHVLPAAGVNPFPGELPEEIRPTDRRRGVEGKIGAPLLSNTDFAGYSAKHLSKRIEVAYARRDARDADNPIASISLIAPFPEFEEQAQKLGPAGSTHLRFRLAAPAFEAPGPETEPFVDPDAQPAGTKVMRVYREVILDETAVERAGSVIEDGTTDHFAVAITLTLEGGVRLNKFTAGHINERMAIILGDQVILAPNIQTPMGADIVITMGKQGNNPKAFLLAERLHAVVNSLPAATPRP